jgi:hypothetical protein
MIKRKRIALLFITVMLLSMTVFSSVALADGSERTEPAETPQPTVAPTPVPTPATQGSAFTNEGNMALVDNLFSKNTNKQFITVESKNGQLFYIVIDYDAVQNEETDSYAVHFLNMVDEADLMALLEELDIDVPDKTPEPTPTPKPTVEVITEPEEPDGMNGGILLIVFALLVGGVIFYYFKVIKKKPKQKVPSYTDEYDMDDDDIWEKEV